MNTKKNKDTQKNIIIIVGPTAIGKSNHAIELAKKNNAEIISADAFQVYKEMDIGTAKVSKKLLNEIPHHLINIKTPNEPYSVVEFLKFTNEIIQKVSKKNKPIIICGGTGFYIQSFLYNYQFPNQKQINTNPNTIKIRKELELECQNSSAQYMWEKLNKLDPEAAKIMSPNDKRRIIRALEVIKTTNKLASSFRQRTLEPRKDTTLIGLTAPKPIIHNRINERVDLMIKEGLIQEVEMLLKKYDSNSQAFQALGYKQVIEYLKGRIQKEEMIECIKIKTRQFAKRQMVWFKKVETIQWHNINQKRCTS